MNARLTLPLLLAATFAVRLPAAVILSDNFDAYTAGQINGDTGNPQTGSYENNWSGTTSGGSANFTADGRLQITRPSGSFNGGYYANINPAGNAGGGNVIYFSAYLTLDTGVEGALFGVDLGTDDTRLSMIGINSSGNAAIWNNPSLSTSNSGTMYTNVLTNDETAVGTGTFALGNTYHLVGKIEDAANWAGSNDRVTLWVNPTLGSGEGANAHEVQVEVSFNGLFPSNSAIDDFWFIAGTNNAGESAYLDDLVIGTAWGDVTAIPEPSAFALFGLAGIAATLVLRRRKA